MTRPAPTSMPRCGPRCSASARLHRPRRLSLHGPRCRCRPAQANPWTLLADVSPATQPRCPAVLDQATAQWGLKLGGVGAEFTLPDDAGEPARFRIVGLLEPGILQGFVIVAEGGFEQIFPSSLGLRAWRWSSERPSRQPRRADVAGPCEPPGPTRASSITPAARRLASLQAVQNTFLAGFQALGTLGLLLGTAGVAAVQLQGMFERIGRWPCCGRSASPWLACGGCW